VIVKRMVGADEAKRALEAAIREAAKDNVPMSFAVVDTYGEIVAAVRMDGSPARILRHAIRQAYTSGVMQRDTMSFKKQLRERDGNLDEWGDPMLTTLPGGVAIRHETEVIGGIGAGGNSLTRDREIAEVAARAIVMSDTAPDEASRGQKA
jgi:glc operon protein GlcG